MVEPTADHLIVRLDGDGDAEAVEAAIGEAARSGVAMAIRFDLGRGVSRDVARSVARSMWGYGDLLARNCVGLGLVVAPDDDPDEVLAALGRLTVPATALHDGSLLDGWIAGQLAAGAQRVRPVASGRTVGASPQLYDYVLDHMSQPLDSTAAELAETTRQRFGAMAGMNIGEDQGRFLKLLVEMTGARTAVEIGTFTGMSALWVARGLGPEGTLHCFDISDEYPAVGRPYWQRAGVDDRIQLHIGPAAERLDDLGDQAIDFAFIDADKAGYASYIEALLPRMSPRGLIVLDNVLWSGMVAGPPAPGDTGALQDLNDHLAGRADLDVLMLTIGDGITLIRKR
ncbi:MAG: O-methyltransferase [Acidimicrobiales bacterium]